MRPSFFWDVTQCRWVDNVVSTQTLGPICNGQAILALENRTDRTSRNFGNSTLRNIPKKEKISILFASVLDDKYRE